MPIFTDADLSAAVSYMLMYHDAKNPAFRGLMSGIYRRGRARAIVAYCQQLDPPPPDASITTMQRLQSHLFGRAVAHTTLQQHFATPGRKADDRVDVDQFNAWLKAHESRFKRLASQTLRDLKDEWRMLTHQAATIAGQKRREEYRELRRADQIKGTAAS